MKTLHKDFVRAPRDRLLWFAMRQEGKLRLNEHKGGWGECSREYLLCRLKEEVAELEKAVRRKKNYKQAEVESEAADVGNLAMMIADNAGAYDPNRLIPTPRRPNEKGR